MGQEVLLQMTDICKEFPGVKAEHEAVRKNVEIGEPGMPPVQFVAEVSCGEYRSGADENAPGDNRRHQQDDPPGSSGAVVQQDIHGAEHADSEQRDGGGYDDGFQPPPVF